MANINLLGVFAVGLGLYSVIANLDQVGSTYWLTGMVVGLVAFTAWRRDRRIGAWFAGAAAVLWVVMTLTSGDARSPESLALTSGVCAGMLAALAGGYLLPVAKERSE